MTIKYALKHATAAEDIIKKSNGVITNPYTYIDTTQDIAETDEKHGVSAVFNKQGDRVTPWITPNNPYVITNIENVKTGNPPLADCMGTMLTEGDYVLTSFGDSHSMIVCRVLGFTAKMIKLHDLSRNRVVARDPKLLVKVCEEII